MGYASITVSGGGIVVKSEKKWILNMLLTDAPTESLPNFKVVSLIRESALRGMLFYLCGHTSKMVAIAKDRSLDKLSGLISAAISTVQVRVIKKPFITSFFERRDTHAQSSNFIDNPTVKLHEYTFEQANGSLKLFEDVLRKKFQTSSLGKIHSALLEAEEKMLASEFNYTIPVLKYIPKQSKMGAKIFNYLANLSLQVADKTSTNKLYINRALLEVIEDIDIFCRDDIQFRERLEKSKESMFSLFTGLKYTKLWVDKRYYVPVRGAMKHIVKTDFILYFPDISEELLGYLGAGPGMANWGEGGNAELEIFCEDELLPSEFQASAWPVVTLHQLRVGGVPLRKLDWEGS